LIKNIKDNYYSFLLAAASTFIIILVGFLSGKIVSTELGVSGMASYGVYINFISLIFIFSNGGINFGILSLNKSITSDKDEKNIYFKKVLSIAFFISFFLTIILFIFLDTFILKVIKQPNLSFPLKFAVLTLFIPAINSTILSYINSIGDLKKLTKYKVIQSILSLVSLIALFYFMDGNGIFYTLSISQLIFLFTILVFDFEIRGVIKSISFKWFNSTLFKQLIKFSLITLSTAIISPIAQLITRNILINDFGLFNAGLWQSVLRISDGYMLLFTTAILYMYLPEINQKLQKNEFVNHLISVFVPLLIFAFLLFTLIYIFRFDIVKLFYNKQFYLATDMFLYQIVGDFFKLLSFGTIYFLIAKGNFKVYIFIDVFFAFIEVILTFIFAKNGLEQAPVISHLISMILLFIGLLLFRKNIFKFGNE
jgi:PST family polysaccharide transporter